MSRDLLKMTAVQTYFSEGRKQMEDKDSRENERNGYGGCCGA